MNNELTESKNALNCIIENYINELQRNTCDDDEEDMRIYKEKMDYIKSQKEIVLQELEILEIIKKWFMEHITDYREYDSSLFVDTFIRDDEPIFKILEEWLNDK